MSDWQRIKAAARRYGPSVDHIAQRYRNPVTGGRLSGEALLLKLTKGESGGRKNAVSNKGAKAWTQFMPGTRDEVVRKFGVDPYRSPEEAVHAAALHLRGKVNGNVGLEGYNPGGGEQYVSYILGQRVGRTSGSSSAGARPQFSPVSGTASANGGAGKGTSAFLDAADQSALAAKLRQAMETQQGPAPLPQGDVQAPQTAAGPVMPDAYPGAPAVSGPAPVDVLDGVARAAAAMSAGGAVEFGGPEAFAAALRRPADDGKRGVEEALAWARSTIGTREQGENRGPRIDQWQAKFGLKGQAWCAMWTSLAVTKGGAPKNARTASVAEVRRQAMQGGGGYRRGFVRPQSAKPGDLILFGNSHIGMVERVTRGGIVMIAGNDSDRVQRRTVGFGSGDVVRPKYGRR